MLAPIMSDFKECGLMGTMVEYFANSTSMQNYDGKTYVEFVTPRRHLRLRIALEAVGISFPVICYPTQKYSVVHGMTLTDETQANDGALRFFKNMDVDVYYYAIQGSHPEFHNTQYAMEGIDMVESCRLVRGCARFFSREYHRPEFMPSYKMQGDTIVDILSDESDYRDYCEEKSRSNLDVCPITWGAQAQVEAST